MLSDLLAHQISHRYKYADTLRHELSQAYMSAELFGTTYRILISLRKYKQRDFAGLLSLR